MLLLLRVSWNLTVHHIIWYDVAVEVQHARNTETTDTMAIVAVEGRPNKEGRYYTEKELSHLAEQHPERLLFQNGILYLRSGASLDEQQQFQWDVSISYHVEQQHAAEKDEAISRLLAAFSDLRAQLTYRTAHGDQLLTLSEYEEDVLRKVADELNEILKDQYTWAGLQDT